MTTASTSNSSDKLLDAAEGLILSKGFAATRVDEICEAAGASKGGFYHLFPSKEDLGIAVLKRYYERGRERLLAGPFRRVSDPEERLFGFLDSTEAGAEELWRSGCLLGTFATELSQSNPTIAAEVARVFDSLIGEWAAIFEPVVRDKGLEDQGYTARELAELYLAAIEGSIVIARAYNDPSRIPKALHRFRDYVSRILK